MYRKATERNRKYIDDKRVKLLLGDFITTNIDANDYGIDTSIKEKLHKFVIFFLFIFAFLYHNIHCPAYYNPFLN
ncbi:MAG: hypothetical protein ABI863_08175 [Ginsengibacter sp.]